MTTRRAGEQTHESPPDSKRPRLLDTTSMTYNNDLVTPESHGCSLGLKAGRGSGGAATATRAVGLLGRQGMVDRTQYVRLLGQALSALGYAEVAEQLERAAGIAVQAPEVNQLQEAVLGGDWAAAQRHLSQLNLGPQQAQQDAQFLILEQAYLEALQAGDSAAALACLREQLAPLGADPGRLHQLAARLMGPGGALGSGAGAGKAAAAGAEAVAGWDRAVEDGCAEGETREDARRGVLRRLQAIIPPEVMLPERRLEALVEQALCAQVASCRFHNTPGARPSLLRDYACGTEQIPTCTTQVLLDHSDEVWHLQFSHSGTMLASCGKDQTAILWEVQCSSGGGSSRGEGDGSTGGSSGGGSGGARRMGSVVSRRHVLRGHTGPIAFLCWSPDDSKLATCGKDALRLWDTATGSCLRVLRHHKEPVTCAAWFPDGRRLVTGSHDKQLCIVNLEGAVERQWRIQRIQEVLVAKGGRYILATTCERKVRVYDLATDTESSIPESEPLISMSQSRDGRFLLLNLTSNAMHLWDCGDHPGELSVPSMPCAVYKGASDKPSRFVVRSCLGGLDDRFVLTGSEECRVYVYHRQTGERLLSLEGHSGTVNSVAWNPADPHMFASASDDKSVHVWRTPPPAAAAAGGGATLLPGAATQ